MVKKRFILILAVCLCICLLPFDVLGANTADAEEFISTDMPCTLNLTFPYDGEQFVKKDILLYKVADISEEYQYTYTEKFSGCTVKLNGIKTNSEWSAFRDTLKSYIISNSISEDSSRYTDEKGTCVFENLSPGLYYIPEISVTIDDVIYSYSSVLAAVPSMDEGDGTWDYDVSVYPKNVHDLTDPDGKLLYTVVKLWKDSGNKDKRPNSVEIDIYKNNIIVETVVLSEKNSWSYSWSAENDGSIWTVAEKNVPDGYTMTIEKRYTTFIVTNTIPGGGNSNTPETGDTSNIGLYAAIMCVSGIALVILGITQKRNRK